VVAAIFLTQRLADRLERLVQLRLVLEELGSPFD
jgi:hypothetical protein